jgi:hypothetical protein
MLPPGRLHQGPFPFITSPDLRQILISFLTYIACGGTSVVVEFSVLTCLPSSVVSSRCDQFANNPNLDLQLLPNEKPKPPLAVVLSPWLLT